MTVCVYLLKSGQHPGLHIMKFSHSRFGAPENVFLGLNASSISQIYLKIPKTNTTLSENNFHFWKRFLVLILKWNHFMGKVFFSHYSASNEISRSSNYIKMRSKDLAPLKMIYFSKCVSKAFFYIQD